YDALSRLTTLTAPVAGALQFDYDTVSRVRTLTRPNGVVETFTYDRSDLVSSWVAARGSVISRTDYGFDGVGRRSSRADASGTAAFAFDLAGRVTGATYTNPQFAGETYQYDSAGQRTAGPGMPIGSFTYDAAGRLLQDASSTYTSDVEGNVVV